MFETLFERRGLSLDRLRAFVAVADAGGIARAAPRDPVRQSQLSRQISELEEYFGHALIRRAGRSVELTELGQRLAGVVRSTFGGLLDVAREGDASPIQFTVGGGDSLMHWWVIPRLGRALGRVPRASVSLVALSTPDVVTRLEDGRLDFGLVRGRPASSVLSMRPLGKLAYALFVPRKLRGPRPATLETARSLPIALQHGEPDQGERTLRVGLGGHPRSILECETFPQVCRAVQTGGYVGLLPTIARDDLHDCDELRVPGALRMSASVHLAWHPRTEKTRAYGRQLAEALADELARPKREKPLRRT